MEQHPNPESALSALLRDVLFVGESASYRRWLAHLPRGRDILVNLPGDNASLADLVDASIQLLRNRNQIDHEFFDYLLAARPHRRGEISRVRFRWLASDEHSLPPVQHPADPAQPLTPDGDITALLLRDAPTIELFPAVGPPLQCQRLALQPGQTTTWDIGPPFSPPLRLRLGPGPRLTVGAPHHLTYGSHHKAQSVALDDGPAAVVVVQTQPAVRRATLRIVHGVADRHHRRYTLLPDYDFSLARGLPGRVIALHVPSATVSPVILWLMDVV